ncbi:MAG: ABC transporter permease [Clostridiales bacterium]|nr:ABC transporter permease [Clostridiales bacterium]
MMGFPFVIIAMVLLTLLGSNIPSLVLVLCISSWPTLSRMIRATVTLQKGMDYISAGKVAGASRLRIAVKYIGTNIWPTLLPLTPLNIASTIINESLMSFIQIGVQPPGISLGTIMADGKSYIATEWWITGIPGFVIMFVVLGLNFIGDSYSNKLSQLDGR